MQGTKIKGGYSLFEEVAPFDFPPSRGDGVCSALRCMDSAALSATARQRGILSFRREYPPLDPPRERRGAFPLDPRIGSRALEGVRSLRSVGACCFLYLNDLTYFYLRCCAAVGSFAALRMRHTPCGCRFACVSAAFSNFRLLRMLSALRVPTRAALLRSPRLFALSVEGNSSAPTEDWQSGSGQ